MERFGETEKREVKEESDTGDKNIVEGVVQKWLLFFEKNLNRIANLDQKTCKKKTMKGKLGKGSITSSLYKTNKCKLNKVRQSKPCNNSKPRSWLSCCKNSKVVYFKWTMLRFVSKIIFNLFLLFTRKPQNRKRGKHWGETVETSEEIVEALGETWENTMGNGRETGETLTGNSRNTWGNRSNTRGNTGKHHGKR